MTKCHNIWSSAAIPVVLSICSVHVRTNFCCATTVCEVNYFITRSLRLTNLLSEFGLYVNRQGNPSRANGIIEWEGTAERVALHAPYILLFDTRFIEIRHIETGRLVQIIPGNDIRCVWDGRSLDGGAAIVAAEGTEEHMVQEPRVHAVMNLSESVAQPGGRPRGIMQHVFELFPTVRLYLPGSLASPSTAPYIPISFSPPRSPPIRSHHV